MAKPLPALAPKRTIHSSFSHTRAGWLTLAADEKLQLAHRSAPELVRHVLAQFRTQELSLCDALDQLQLAKSRFYELYSDYLRACAHHQESLWIPGLSGGDHARPWPPEVIALLRKRLSSKPPASYSFAASEVLRLCDFQLDRAQVRRWAIENHLAHGTVAAHPPAPVRRWQRSHIGELWQLDASPHRYLPGSKIQWPMLNLLDDCSRLFTASKLYERELLLSYYDLLPAAFLEYGRPLQLYVDYHSIFFTSTPDALTQLGAALRFYGIGLRYAPTPQAKGKVEREHQFWQKRLPAYFASENITTLEAANRHLDALRRHRNQKEKHRELNMTPQAAWNLAKKEKRSVLRPVPRCPWWPYVWSVRTTIKIGSDGRVPIGSQRLRVSGAPGAKVVLCLHPSGHHSVLQHEPNADTTPQLLFTNRP